MRMARTHNKRRGLFSFAGMIQPTLVFAGMMMLWFPLDLRSLVLAIGAGYIFTVNLSILILIFEGIQEN